MINFTRVSTSSAYAAIAVPVLLLGAAGAAHGDALPFPGRGYVSVGGPAAPGQIVDITVKERPGNPRPTAVDVSSPALTDDTVLGDTGRAWVGAGRIKGDVTPGTYDVKVTLRHKDADCVGEGEQDYTCDYPPIALHGKLKVAAPQESSGAGEKGPGFGAGVGLGIGASVVAAALGGGAVWARRKRRAGDGAS
ncbi:hypothetical protein KY5_0085c [Streptomyces formicae]|uniref:Integral membrane protein n=1 Tax=Streptomyces formicae TaxID=1616117 RepID=A0A291Q0R0_9ACTN|nr:hypothetical protein KY5_0085c [Streptomyces formicae]